MTAVLDISEFNIPKKKPPRDRGVTHIRIQHNQKKSHRVTAVLDISEFNIPKKKATA